MEIDDDVIDGEELKWKSKQNVKSNIFTQVIPK